MKVNAVLYPYILQNNKKIEIITIDTDDMFLNTYRHPDGVLSYIHNKKMYKVMRINGELIFNTPKQELKELFRKQYDKELIEKYRSGNGRSTMVNGEEFIAKEAVFYINSVSEIIKIIKRSGLRPEETTIICSSKSDNIKKLDETNLSIIGYAKRSFEG